MISVLNKPVSYFPNVRAISQGSEQNLLRLLSSDEHKTVITSLRNAPADKQDRLKNRLPCFTVTGVFEGGRTDEHLKLSSGLACVDMDSAEDYDALNLLTQLKMIPHIAYAGLSCRGNRLFCIIPFKFPDQYKRQYERLIKSFEDMGIGMGDDCHKAISQPRFVSWNSDDTQFFNHNAEPYELIESEKQYYLPVSKSEVTKSIHSSEEKFNWCVKYINVDHSFVSNQRHAYIVKLARYCNIKGLPEAETLNGCLGFVQEDFNEEEIKSIVKSIYTKHKNSHGAIPFR